MTKYYLRHVWMEGDMIRGCDAGGPYDCLQDAERCRNALHNEYPKSQIDILTREGRVVPPRNSNSQ